MATKTKKLALMFVFLALAITSRVQAQCPAPLVTSDSLLNHGKETSVSYAAPGTGSGIAIVSPAANPAVELWELFPNPWNVLQGSGSIDMTYSGTGSITTKVNLKGLNIDAVNAFPMIFYGGDEFGDHAGTQPPKFPVQLSSLCSLVSDVAYSFSGPTMGGDMDILYDEYLIPSAGYTGGQGGALDVAIIPYFNFAVGPGGTYVKTITEPVTVNGVATTMDFDEYVGGSGPGAVVDFDGKAAPSGELRLNLLDFFNEAIATAGGGIVNSSWWVSGIQYGPEFGDGPIENFTFSVTKFELAESIQTSPTPTATATPILKGHVTVSPHSLNFSAAPNSTPSAGVTIGNTGLGDLHANVGSPKHDPPFSILSNGGAVTIAPNSAKIIIIQYAPNKKGTTSDQIWITSDDPKQKKPIKVKLKGKSK